MHRCHSCSNTSDLIDWCDVAFINGEYHQIRYTFIWRSEDKEELHDYILQRISLEYGVRKEDIELYSDNNELSLYTTIPPTAGKQCNNCGMSF